jgi:hypothetical protein
MCITEIWTYHECGCHYLHPIPCHDRVLESLSKPYRRSENWELTSHVSSSSLSSLLREDAVAETQDPAGMSSSEAGTCSSEDETDTVYNHRLDLVRTCSLRRTVQKTFLEPICDDCLLLELGLAPENGSPNRRHDDEHDGRNLDGAEWLLESSVEITVESPDEGDDIFRLNSKLRTPYSSSEDESEDETPRRGRGRRRAMEITRESLSIEKGSPLKRRSSFQELIQTDQHLRRARKQHDLKSSLTTGPRPSTSSSTRPPSWIEHLKSDLGHRVRRKRPDVSRSESDPTQQTWSPIPPSTSTAEDDRILSIPSIPTTASSTFSATSGEFEASILLPLDQIISSSEFESSQLSDRHISDTRPQTLQADRRESARLSTSSSRSTNSFHAPNFTVSPSPSPVAPSLAGSSGVISLHPLSCPLTASTYTKMGALQDRMQNDDDGNDRDEKSNSKEERTNQRNRDGIQIIRQ